MLTKFKLHLLTPIPNTSLVFFRMAFGLLVAAEGFGAILTGWVDRVLIQPTWRFTFIGFEFLNALTGPWMYGYFAFMGLCGICVMLGFHYRKAIIAFALTWSAVYLSQKTAYNNHYYLLALLNWAMVFMPAANAHSLDAKAGRVSLELTMPRWVRDFFIFQMVIVYTYAALAKVYPDWLEAMPVKLWLSRKKDTPLVGYFFQFDWFAYFVSYTAILFDLLIAPAMLWGKTRKVAFITAIGFHIFNSIVFHIGIFPFLALGLMIFFYPPEQVEKWFYTYVKRPQPSSVTPHRFKGYPIFLLYFVIQTLLPIRHWFIPGDVLWTEEGHKLSWRMMLRAKRGSFRVKIHHNEEQISIRLKDHLTKKQIAALPAHPDFIFQFVQKLKKEYQETWGTDEFEIYVSARIGVNGRPTRPVVSYTQDLSKVKFNYFGHNDWVLPWPEENQNWKPKN